MHNQALRLTYYIDIEDIKGLYETLKDQVAIVQALHTPFYGKEEFAIRDCNGFILAFITDAA